MGFRLTMTPRFRRRVPFAIFALLPVLVSACATTAQVDQAGAALAVAKSWQEALAAGDFGGALALVDENFSSPAWRTREDLRFYLEQARDRGYFKPATIISEPVKLTLTSEQVVVYPVGIRARAGLSVFRLTLAPRDAEWKIVSATLEFY